MFSFFSKKKEARDEKVIQNFEFFIRICIVQKVDVLQLLTQNQAARDTLLKRQEHLERRIAAQVEDAKLRAQNGDKRGALFALKRKKMLEEELEMLVKTHFTLEQKMLKLESAKSQQIAVEALAASVSAQKVLNQQMNLNKLDDLMEDLAEQAQVQSEIGAVLTQGQNLMDDEDLMLELQQIEAQSKKKIFKIRLSSSRFKQSDMDDVLSGIAAAPSTELSAGPGVAQIQSPPYQDASAQGLPMVTEISSNQQRATLNTLSDEEEFKRLMQQF